MLRIEKVKGMKQAIVYGCGNFGKQCISYMKEKNIAVWACCDSDKKRWGKEFEGYPIISPDELKNNKKDLVIVAMEQSKEQIIKLLDMGFEVGLFYKILEEKAIYQIKNKRVVLGCKTKEALRGTFTEEEFEEVRIFNGEKI